MPRNISQCKTAKSDIILAALRTAVLSHDAFSRSWHAIGHGKHGKGGTNRRATQMICSSLRGPWASVPSTCDRDIRDI